MRILVSAVTAKPHGGSESHLVGLLQALEGPDRENEYLLCVNRTMKIISSWPRLRVLSVPVQTPVRRLWWDLVRLPVQARRCQADLLVALLSFGSPRPPCPQIVFARNPLFCDYYELGLGAAARIALKVRRWFMYRTMRASRLIVCPSRAMKEMIRNRHPELPEERFRVLPHALEPIDRDGPRELPPELERLLRPGRAGDGVRLLYVGHLLPYKGLDVVVAALQRLRAAGLRAQLYLTIAREDWPAGFDRWRRGVERAGLTEGVIVLGKVDRMVARRLYPRCDMLLFPSLCESFGFPLVEAMGWGLPIVAADTPLNREMAGDAAVYYPPLSADDCATAILRLAASPEVCAGLGENGLRRAAAHPDWFQYAGEVLELYKRAASP